MIVCCPSCIARFRLDPKKYGDKRITLKCSRCSNAITATVPRSYSVESLDVLIGHGDQRVSDEISQILTSSGIASQVCRNGHEVLGVLKSMHPAVVLLDVAMPEIFTFQVLDTLRTNNALENTKVLLISSVYNSMAYKRPPSSLYGADDYLDESCLADDLVTKIRNLAGTSGEELPVEVDVNSTDSAEAKAPSSRMEIGETGGDPPARSVREAQKIARKIVSDIARRDLRKVKAAIRAGNFFRIFDEEIREGNRLFEQQVDSEIRMQEDYLHQAFLSFLASCRRELQQKKQVNRGGT